jgi:hypothetical protein
MHGKHPWTLEVGNQFLMLRLGASKWYPIPPMVYPLRRSHPGFENYTCGLRSGIVIPPYDASTVDPFPIVILGSSYNQDSCRMALPHISFDLTWHGLLHFDIKVLSNNHIGYFVAWSPCDQFCYCFLGK